MCYVIFFFMDSNIWILQLKFVGYSLVPCDPCRFELTFEYLNSIREKFVLGCHVFSA